MKKIYLLLVATSIVLCACACTSAPRADAVRPYPFKTCLVTDNALGSMGDPITKIYEGREIKFCCAPCVAEFEANPAAFLSKLKD